MHEQICSKPLLLSMTQEKVTDRIEKGSRNNSSVYDTLIVCSTRNDDICKLLCLE